MAPLTVKWNLMPARVLAEPADEVCAVAGAHPDRDRDWQALGACGTRIDKMLSMPRRRRWW
ncbi:MAG: hypothetical protein ACRDSM_06355 [Pseudonocardiaceae bacterium]